jgi:hypothetical protein
MQNDKISFDSCCSDMVRFPFGYVCSITPDIALTPQRLSLQAGFPFLSLCPALVDGCAGICDDLADLRAAFARELAGRISAVESIRWSAISFAASRGS